MPPDSQSQSGDTPARGAPGLADTVIDFLQGAREQIDDPAWGYLLNHIDPFTGLWVAAGLELGRRAEMSADEQVAQIIEPGILEPELLDRINAQLDAAEVSDERRDQLKTGLAFAAGRKHHLAVPMLLSPLEGGFWRVAEQRGLVEQNADGIWFRKEPRKRIQITEVFDLPGMDVGERFAGFARALVYGRVGNQHRHGTAETGWQVRALFLVVSVVEWLDLQGLMDARQELRHAFIRASEARREERARAGS